MEALLKHLISRRIDEATVQKFTTFVTDEEFDSVGVTWDISSDRNGSNIAVHMNDDHLVDALKTFFKQNQSVSVCDCLLCF